MINLQLYPTGKIPVFSIQINKVTPTCLLNNYLLTDISKLSFSEMVESRAAQLFYEASTVTIRGIWSMKWGFALT